MCPVHHFHIQFMVAVHYTTLLWFINIIIMAIFFIMDVVLAPKCIFRWIYVVFEVIIDGFEVFSSFGALR